jgi:ABC-2 type transport system ATP-binding protein
MTAAISVESLRKTYGSVTAVDDISFTAECGTVTALVGPNGSGKTTTLRILVGLARQSHGSAKILGCRYRDLPLPGKTVGVVLDSDSFDPARSAVDHLRVYASSLGVNDARVKSLLHYVGLDQMRAKGAVRKFSLGMRQRLALATALLGEPSVLIMDEPANGLDPEAASWLDAELRDFARVREGSVLLSTHSLSQVERVADSIVIMVAGKLAYSGATEALRDGLEAASVWTSDTAALIGVARDAGASASISSDGSVRVMGTSVATVVKCATEAGLTLSRVVSLSLPLDEKVMLLTRSPSGRTTLGNDAR